MRRVRPGLARRMPRVKDERALMRRSSMRPSVIVTTRSSRTGALALVRHHEHGRCRRPSSSLRSSRIISPVWLSRFPVGSSAAIRAGSFARARATATRCCWPPDRRLGTCPTWSTSPTEASRSRALASRSWRAGGCPGSPWGASRSRRPSAWGSAAGTGRRRRCGRRATGPKRLRRGQVTSRPATEPSPTWVGQSPSRG